METQALDQTDHDDDRVTAYRARLKGMLNEVAQEVKLALAEKNIDIPVFFLIGHSGQSILSFGTVLDPDDASWSQVAGIVAGIVGKSIGITGVRCVEMHCATTDTLADRQPQASSICQPAPTLEAGG
jgi:hypothetical protein